MLDPTIGEEVQAAASNPSVEEEEAVEVEVVEDGARVVAPDNDQKRGTEKKIRKMLKFEGSGRYPR